MRHDHFLNHQSDAPNNGEPYFGEAASVMAIYAAGRRKRPTPSLFGSLPLWLFAIIGATIGAVAFAMVWGMP